MPGHAPVINTPIRSKPFLPSCHLSGNEIELVTERLESSNWSSFKGATEGWDEIAPNMMKAFGVQWNRLTRSVLEAAHARRGDLLIVIDDADQLAPDLLERIWVPPYW